MSKSLAGSLRVDLRRPSRRTRKTRPVCLGIVDAGTAAASLLRRVFWARDATVGAAAARPSRRPVQFGGARRDARGPLVARMLFAALMPGQGRHAAITAFDTGPNRPESRPAKTPSRAPGAPRVPLGQVWDLQVALEGGTRDRGSSRAGGARERPELVPERQKAEGRSALRLPRCASRRRHVGAQGR